MVKVRHSRPSRAKVIQFFLFNFLFYFIFCLIFGLISNYVAIVGRAAGFHDVHVPAVRRARCENG